MIIEKEVWLETADIDKNGDVITERHSILRSTSFTNNHLIIVNTGGELTLKNIIINGQLTYTKQASGSNILISGTSTNNPD